MTKTRAFGLILLLAAADGGAVASALSTGLGPPPGRGAFRPVIAFLIPSGREEPTAVLLAASLRRFGGGFAGSEILAMTEAGGRISPPVRARLEGLGCRITPFTVPGPAQRFPLGAMPYAAAAAEIAAGQADTLVWMDSDTLILREPGAFRLPDGKSLGFRPVMHLLIGSLLDQPVDSFWRLVYGVSGVSEERIFPMTTPVDGARIRPYFNAGLLVVRPGLGLLSRWRDDFERLIGSDGLRPLLEKDHLYAVFAPQAALAGALLSRLERREMIELSADYNYSLQLHGRYAEGSRVSSLSGLTSVRYDQIRVLAEDPAWRSGIEMDEPHQSWLEQALADLGLARRLEDGGAVAGPGRSRGRRIRKETA